MAATTLAEFDTAQYRTEIAGIIARESNLNKLWTGGKLLKFTAHKDERGFVYSYTVARKLKGNIDLYSNTKGSGFVETPFFYYDVKFGTVYSIKAEEVDPILAKSVIEGGKVAVMNLIAEMFSHQFNEYREEVALYEYANIINAYDGGAAWSQVIDMDDDYANDDYDEIATKIERMIIILKRSKDTEINFNKKVTDIVIFGNSFTSSALTNTNKPGANLRDVFYTKGGEAIAGGLFKSVRYYENDNMPEGVNVIVCVIGAFAAPASLQDIIIKPNPDGNTRAETVAGTFGFGMLTFAPELSIMGTTLDYSPAVPTIPYLPRATVTNTFDASGEKKYSTYLDSKGTKTPEDIKKAAKKAIERKDKELAAV